MRKLAKVYTVQLHSKSDECILMCQKELFVSSKFQTGSSLRSSECYKLPQFLIGNISHKTSCWTGVIKQQDLLFFIHLDKMASKLWTKEEISCPVCLNTLTEPTTLPCGHNFCLDCIRKCLDESGSISSSNKVSFCPYCRETFCRRPILRTQCWKRWWRS